MSVLMRQHSEQRLWSDVFLSMKIVVILANSTDSDEMPPYAFSISSGSSLFAKVPV